jgi:hypothetical protein
VVTRRKINAGTTKLSDYAASTMTFRRCPMETAL